MVVSKIVFQICDLIEMLVYALLLKVGILMLKNVLCWGKCVVWYLL